MSGPKDRHTAEAYIKKGYIVIDVPIDVLPHAFKAGRDLGAIEADFKITDPKAFAQELIHVLNDEDEQGTTRIHKLFDEAMVEAIEQGAQGVEEVEVDEMGLDIDT